MAKSEPLFLAVLASLPVQLGKLTFTDHSFVLGIPIDYRAISVYLIDLLVVSYLFFFLLENRKNLKKIYLLRKSYINSLLVLNIYLILNSLFFSASKSASLVFNFKILEFSVLSVFALQTLSKNRLFKNSLRILAFSACWQSILLIMQFITQKSQGLWFFGERSFDATTSAIAHVQILNKFLLRPYGTFPHPNVAAAFLTFTLIMLVANRPGSLIKKLIIFLTLTSAVLTFSKTALLIIVIGYLFTSSSLRNLLFKGAALIILVLPIISSLGENQVASVAERLTLTQAALDIALVNPLFGIGSNNFILELSKLDLTSISQVRLLQPVHNVFLLILTENGLFGFLFFVIFLYIVFKNVKSKLKLFLALSVLIFASVDHFFWTLEQGQLLFWLTLAVIQTNNTKESKNLHHL